MKISGSYTLYAPRERVWMSMLDPSMLARTVPGCEELEQDGPDRLRGRLSVGIASVKGTYEGTLEILERVAPDYLRLRVDGKGTTGILHGEGVVRLEARGPSTTIVTYEGHTQLGGPIATVAMRVLNAAARMLVNQFFARLADALAAADSAPGNGVPVNLTLTPTPIAIATPIPTTHSAAKLTEVTWSAGLPEARPLEAEQTPAEARPLESAARSAPAPISSREATASAAPAHPAGVQWVPAPSFLTRLVRQAGLSDGSSESEERIARQLFLAGAGALAATLALAIALLSGRRGE
jgi:carbon monoxide dehydrogenase subunit G